MPCDIAQLLEDGKRFQFLSKRAMDIATAQLLCDIAANGPGATTFLELTDTPASYAGQANKVVAVNAGETGLEFVAAPGGTPGGANTNVQFNNAGAFGGSSSFTWNGSKVFIQGGPELIEAYREADDESHINITLNDQVISFSDNTLALGCNLTNSFIRTSTGELRIEDSLGALSDLTCDVLTFSASDPELETFYPVTLARALQLLQENTPPAKRGGASLYFDVDAKELRVIDQQTSALYRVPLEKIADIVLDFSAYDAKVALKLAQQQARWQQKYGNPA